MEKIELEQKSDRELLIMAVLQQNQIIDMVVTHHKTLYGNGKPGLVFLVTVLCGVVALLAVDSPSAQRFLAVFMK
jgi:hypothetical protein